MEEDIQKLKKQLAQKNAKLKKNQAKLKIKTMEGDIEQLKGKLKERDEQLQNVILEYDAYWKETNKESDPIEKNTKQPIVKYKSMLNKKVVS